MCQALLWAQQMWRTKPGKISAIGMLIFQGRESDNGNNIINNCM